MGLVKSMGDPGLWRQARDRGRRLVAYGYGIVTSIADIFCLLSYLMMSSKILRMLGRDTFRMYLDSSKLLSGQAE